VRRSSPQRVELDAALAAAHAAIRENRLASDGLRGAKQELSNALRKKPAKKI
jgi:hypothetical protein